MFLGRQEEVGPVFLELPGDAALATQTVDLDGGALDIKRVQAGARGQKRCASDWTPLCHHVQLPCKQLC